MRAIDYCRYDNPVTMQREEWYQGQNLGITPFEDLPEDCRPPWCHGSVHGDPYAMYHDWQPPERN